MSQTPEVTNVHVPGASPQSPADLVLDNKVEMGVLNLKLEGYVAHVQKLGEENAALKDRVQKLVNLPDPNERRKLEAKLALLRQKVESLQVEKGNEELLLTKRSQDLVEVKTREVATQEALDAAKQAGKELRQKNDQLKKEIDQLKALQKDKMMELETALAIKQKTVAEYNQNQHVILAQKVAEHREEWQKDRKKEKELLVRDYKSQVARLEADLTEVEKEHSNQKIAYATLDDEIKGTNQKSQNLREEIRNLQENMEKERTEKDREVGRLKRFIDIKQGDIERLRVELQTKKQVVSEANDNNVSLRSEILSYKRLLEQEETRLNLRAPQRASPPALKLDINAAIKSPSITVIRTPVVESLSPVTASSPARSSTSGPSGSSSSSSSSGNQKKRPLEIDSETPQQESYKASRSQNWEQEPGNNNAGAENVEPEVLFSEKKSGDAAIAEVRLQDETVEIRNNSNPPRTIDLNRWFVQIGNKNMVGTRYFHPLRYKFPEDTFLPEGESFDLKITGDEFNRSSTELVTPGFFVQLFDGEDELVAEVVLEEQLPANANGCWLM